MKNQRLIIIGLVVGVVVVILIGVLSSLLATKRLDLANFDQVKSGLASGEVAELEGHIWESLQRTQGFADDTKEIVALVRPSSFSRVEQGEIVNYDFIVDVDAYRATYEVSFALMKGEGFYEAPLVECPVPELMKYADTYCEGEKTSTMSVTVGRSLPYYFNLASGELVTVTRETLDGEEYLKVRVSACGDAAVTAAAEKGVREWILSLGHSPDDYEIKTVEFCDGGC